MIIMSSPPSEALRKEVVITSKQRYHPRKLSLKEKPSHVACYLVANMPTQQRQPTCRLLAGESHPATKRDAGLLRAGGSSAACLPSPLPVFTASPWGLLKPVPVQKQGTEIP